MTPTQILNHTSNLTIEQLAQLNRDLVVIIKHRRKMTARDMGSILSIGDEVEFSSKRDGLLRGKIEKIMRTKAIVNIHSMRYKVPMSMLSLK